MTTQAHFDYLRGTFIPMKQWGKAYDAIAAIFEALLHGEKPPLVPSGTYISLGNGSLVCYSILSNTYGDGYATFIRYQFSTETGQMEESHKYNSVPTEA